MIDVMPAKTPRRTRHVRSKFEAYLFNAAKAHEILNELIAEGLIRMSFGAFPTSEQMRGKKDFKFHNVWTHSTTSCIKLKYQIQEWINKGIIQFETAAGVNVAMVEFSQEKRNRRRLTLELLPTKAEEEEEPTPKKAKPTLEASRVVSCSR